MGEMSSLPGSSVWFTTRPEDIFGLNQSDQKVDLEHPRSGVLFLQGAGASPDSFEYQKHLFVNSTVVPWPHQEGAQALGWCDEHMCDMPEKYFGRTAASYAAWLGECLKWDRDTMSSDPKHILIGHSTGGIVATQLAIQFPDRVSAVVLLASGLSRHDLSYAVQASSLLKLILPASQAHELAMSDISMKMLGLGEGYLDSEQSSFAIDKARAMIELTPPHMLNWQTNLVLNQWVPPQLPKGIQFHIIHGDKDGVFSRPPHIKSKTPVVIAGAGHILHWTHAETVNMALSMIARSVDPRVLVVKHDLVTERS